MLERRITTISLQMIHRVRRTTYILNNLCLRTYVRAYDGPGPQFPVGLIAPLVEHCASIAEVSVGVLSMRENFRLLSHFSSISAHVLCCGLSLVLGQKFLFHFVVYS